MDGWAGKRAGNGQMRIAARMAIETEPTNNRRTSRAPVHMSTTMRALGYHGFDVVVRNISEHGFMAETSNDFVEGCYVRLKLPCVGTVLARIAWSKSGQVGGEFLNAVNPVRLRLVMGMGNTPMVTH